MEPIDDKAQFVNEEPPKVIVQKSAGIRKSRKMKKRSLRRKTRKHKK
jgi:hypothetical protein